MTLSGISSSSPRGYDDHTSLQGASLIVTQTRNGVTTNIVDLENHVSGAFGGHIRLYDDASYSATLTLPDGTAFNNPEFHHGDDTLRHYVAQTTLEATTN